MCGVPSVDQEAIREMVENGKSIKCPFGDRCLGNGKKTPKAMMCQVCRSGFGKDGVDAVEYETAIVEKKLARSRARFAKSEKGARSTKPQRSDCQPASGKKVGSNGRINWLPLVEVGREAERISDLIIHARDETEMDDRVIKEGLIKCLGLRSNYGSGLVKHLLIKADEVLKRRNEPILAKPAEPVVPVHNPAPEAGNVAQVAVA